MKAAHVIVGLAIVLAIVHQDFWWWDDTTMVFGFLPIGLAYHALYSVLAGLLWFATVKLAWPEEIEAWADEFDEAEAGAEAE